MDISKVFMSKQFLLLLVAVLLLGVVCADGLQRMVNYWDREEYSHGYMIPFVALYLLWQKRVALSNSIGLPSLFGVFCLVVSLFVWLLGEMSGIFTLIQYAFIMGIFSIALVWLGVKGTLVIWAPIFYLVFMIPLPGFIYNNLSSQLQLISSSIGVGVIRLFDISVYLEGNVIDLGSYQLQVVEACSGLRYLFPLMSFGFLIAYIYRGPVWQKAAIFLSTIPITVLMNSFRIGVIGVTVEHFGIAAAEGFLHDFEGWFVFMACLGVLLFEIWLFYLMSSRSSSFGQLFDLDFGAGADTGSADGFKSLKLTLTHWLALVLLLIAVPISNQIIEREDAYQQREVFTVFPLDKNGWIGRESSIPAAQLDVLDLTDYFIGDYRRGSSSLPVNFYTAWYAAQRKGESIHSPKSCLPGGGWVIQSHTIKPIESIDAYGKPLNVNRVVMQMGEHQQLVYYWFQGRGRNITNEYLAKWYIFWDSLTRNRTDGALVRLVTYVPDGTDIAIAEQRLTDYLNEFYPLFSTYIPD